MDELVGADGGSPRVTGMLPCGGGYRAHVVVGERVGTEFLEEGKEGVADNGFLYWEEGWDGWMTWWGCLLSGWIRHPGYALRVEDAVAGSGRFDKKLR